MADYDITALAAPISDDEPAGPDLEELGDPDYWQFTGAIETELPTNFEAFYEQRQSVVTYDERIKTCYELLERTRDIRLMVWLAKLTILGRDFKGFVDSVETLVQLLDAQWDTVHPLPFEGDQTMRSVNLERLDERPSVELPLMYVRLIEDQTGTVSFRDHLVAVGEAQPREGERFRSAEDIKKTLTRCDVEKITEARDRIDALRETLKRLGALWMDKVGFDQPMQLQRLPALADRIYEFLNSAVAERRPDLAADGPEGAAQEDGPAEGGGEGAPGGGVETTLATLSVPRGAVQDVRDVVNALAAVSLYFETVEPSSPARLLVKQSERLVGRSYIEVVQTLLPDYFDSAYIAIEGRSPFRLPLSALSDRLELGQGYEAAPTFDEEDESESEDETDSGYDTGEEEGTDGDAAYGSEDAADDGAQAQDDADAREPSAPAVETPSPPARRKRPVFAVKHRADAGALLADVVAYYRAVEPSSPLPALLERAQDLLSRDFSQIISDMLAEDSE